MQTEVVDAEIAELDHQPLAPADVSEIARLVSWTRALLDKSDEEVSPDLRDYCTRLLAQLDHEPDEAAAMEKARTYTTYHLTAASEKRNYAVEVRVDDGFGDSKEWVRDRTQTMLNRAVVDQTNRFVVRARSVGMRLKWRRDRTYGFPHTLPYVTPSPDTQDGKSAEEAAVTCAAANFALSRTGIRLTINAFKKPATVKDGKRYWTGGSATVNLYNSDRALSINLNLTAIKEAKFSTNYWASTVAHEILHNLGWGHPNGSYPSDLPIEIWQWCIETAGQAKITDEPADEVLIR